MIVLDGHLQEDNAYSRVFNAMDKIMFQLERAKSTSDRYDIVDEQRVYMVTSDPHIYARC